MLTGRHLPFIIPHPFNLLILILAAIHMERNGTQRNGRQQMRKQTSCDGDVVDGILNEIDVTKRPKNLAREGIGRFWFHVDPDVGTAG